MLFQPNKNKAVLPLDSSAQMHSWKDSLPMALFNSTKCSSYCRMERVKPFKAYNSSFYKTRHAFCSLNKSEKPQLWAEKLVLLIVVMPSGHKY